MSEPQILEGKEAYQQELRSLQVELVKLQYWVQSQGVRVLVLFEGRDAAGKGGVIRRIIRHTSPRIVRVVALPKPSETECGQWYFQRYVAHLPQRGQMVLLDRSWYNRAGVERVMGFCTGEQVQEFFVSCPQFEEMLVREGIHLIKYWFTVSQEEQERRFQARCTDPLKRWKFSPMDVEARTRWVDYSRARDEMFEHCHTVLTPWHVIDADCKLSARLNCIHHLLSQLNYRDMMPPEIQLSPLSDVSEGSSASMPAPLEPVYRVVDL